MYFLLGSRSLKSSFFVYYQIWQKTTSHSNLKKTQKYISAEHLLRNRGHKFKQKKSEIHSLLGGSSFMNEEKSYLVIDGFFSPHVDHFQLI